MTPKISVVTVVKNGRAQLPRTIVSVIQQGDPNLEYIVIDGGSTDGTVDVIREHSVHIDRWVSEEDQGISDAFNKGIALATGDVIGLLNAGDWYADDALYAVRGALQNARSAERGTIYHGDLAYHEEDGSFAFVAKPDISRVWKYMIVYHPTMFVPREVYEQVGTFSLDFHYAMDAEFVHRALVSGVEFVHIPKVLAHMPLGGNSVRNYRESFRDFRDSVIKHGGARLPAHYRYVSSVIKRWLLQYRAGRWLKRVRDSIVGRA